jgi:hypothetical protein
MKQMYLTLYLTLYLTRSCIVILKDNSLNDTQSKITQQHVVLTKIKSALFITLNIFYCHTKQDKWIRHKL